MSRHLITRFLLLAAVVLLQPLAAAAQTPPALRSISGTVVNADSNQAIAGAELSAGEQRTVSDGAGRFSLRVEAGEVAVTVTAPGFFPLTTVVDVRTADVTRVELSLARDTAFETSVSV